MLPSLFASSGNARAWSLRRAALYGAAVGVLAALLKTLGPLHASGSAPTRLLEIAGVTLAFALLCAGAALARNLIARRLIWPKMR